MFTCNDETMACNDIQVLDELERLKSNGAVVNSPSISIEKKDDQDMKTLDEERLEKDNTEHAHAQCLRHENNDNVNLSNLSTGNNDTISKSDCSDCDSSNGFLNYDKNIPRQDSKEKFYNLLRAISLEYGVNSTKYTSPTAAVIHPKTIEEEIVGDDLLENATADNAVSQSQDYEIYKYTKSANVIDQQTTTTRLTSYVTAASISTPTTAPEVISVGTESKTDDSKEVSTQINSPEMTLTSLCSSKGKATEENKKYRAMHKRAHPSYRTSTFINPPSLFDSASTDADSPSAKILDSDIVATPTVESATNRLAKGKRCDTEISQSALAPLLKSNVSGIEKQPELVASPLLQAPTANSEESHIVHEESRYIDDFSNTSAGISLLKSSKRYRRLFGGKKKNKFGDSTMSIIHSDVSMTSNTSILSKRFKKKKKTLAAQQSTKLLMSLNGNDLHDHTIQSKTLLAIHDDIAQQKLALAKKYRKVEAEVFQSERTYQRHLRVIIKVCFVIFLSNALLMTE